MRVVIGASVITGGAAGNAARPATHMSLSPRRRRQAAAGGLPGIAAPLHILATISVIFAAPSAPAVFAAANLAYVRDTPGARTALIRRLRRAGVPGRRPRWFQNAGKLFR